MWRVTRTGSPEVLRVSDSSPDSAETTFRELDDVFLQTQTRIWLGEVLHIRFDENVGIADLLADGELLFQVSKEVWKMLLRKHGELKHSKLHIYERTSSGKSNGRYMPYPKVDSFLKICQILGLTGIDLFSPSDVVEKREIRRVCMCIRSLSKKARSKKLTVPDFDIVTYTIAMPTHLVGGIRRNLELSQYSPSSFSASIGWNDAREICRLRIPYGHHSQHSDSRSDESESNFSDIEFESPFFSASYDATNITYAVGETSPGLSPTTDDFVHDTSFSNSIESNHYEVVQEHQEEMFAESVCYCHLSTTETYMLQNLSSSSYSEHPTDQNKSICFVDIGKGSADSIPKDFKNGLKAEHMAGTLDVETSCEAYMNVSSLNVGPSEDNQHSQSSSPTFSHLEVHSNVEVEPCNTRQKSSVFENAIATYNMAMKNRFYYMETSDDFKYVTPKIYSLDTVVAGNDGNSPSEIKSASILDLSSPDNYSCNSELERSYCTLASKNAYSFFSSFADKQNKFSRSLVHPPERKQNELAHTSLSSIENDCALLSQSNYPNKLAKSKCGSQSTNTLISSFTESEFECSSSSSVCLTCSDVNIGKKSYLVTDSCMQETDVCKENFKTDLNKASLNSLVPFVQEDADIAAHSLSLEEGKFCNDASYRSFQGQFMSSRLKSGIEVGSNVENDKQVDASYQSCQTQENSDMVVKENLSKEPCGRCKCALEHIENHASSSNYTQDKDYECICGSMVDGFSISGLQCMVSTISEQQKSPVKEESVEHTDGLFYYGISSADDSDCSDELKMHQFSHHASDIVFLLSDNESKIPTSKKGPEMTVADKKSSVNPKNCQYDDGKMRDFGHQMNKLNSFCAKDFEVLDVMETYEFASSARASEMIPSFDFCLNDLFQNHRNMLETEGASFQTVHIASSSTADCRERKEVASVGSIEIEKHVSYIHDTCAEPNNAPQAILVPDFDILTYNIAMPTHLVGGIRRNLELSQYSPSSFSASIAWNDAREICRLRIPYGHHSQHSDSRSDESASNFSHIEFESPFFSASYDATNITYIVGETSPGLSPTTDDFVHETSFSNNIESNHYEVVHEHQEEMFAEAVCYCHLSTTETYMLQNLSSSSYSELPTDQNKSICFDDIGKGSADSISKDVKNGLKAEHLAGTLDVETSCEVYMNVSSLNVGPSEDNQHSQSSSPTFSHLEVHSNVEVEPCNTRQKSSVFENAIATYNMAMENRFYYMETSDDFKYVTPKIYSLDTVVAGSDGNSPSEIKSASILDLSSPDNYSCNSELERSYCTLASKNAYSFFSSFADKQNKFSRSLVHPPERKQNELAHTSLSSIENNCALLSQSNYPNKLAKSKCGSQSTNPLISSFTESELECSSSSSVCLTCSDVNIEEESYLVTDSCMQEKDVCKENFKTDLNKASLNSLVPVVQEDADIAAHSLSLEEGKFCNDASYGSFQGQFMSSRLKSGIEMGSIVENDKQVDASYQSCQTQENSEMVVEGNLSKEPCGRCQCALELIENHASSSNYTQDKDHGCGSMVDGFSISGLQCMVSIISEQQKSPVKEESIENTDGLFYYCISSSDDSDCSDDLKMHQSSHDASDIVFLLSDNESKIPTSKKGPEMTVADEKSLVNPENCQYDDGKMSDFGHQMKKLNSFCAKDFEVLDVMETYEFASSAHASEMIPSFDFCRNDLFQNHRNILETEGASFQTVHIPPSSTSDCRERKEVASVGSIEAEKHVVSYIHDTCTEPNNAPQAILDDTMFKKDTEPDECGKSKGREGRTVGKKGNQVLKSVAGVMTLVGAFVLLLHVRQKNDKEKKNEMRMPFQIQKPNREFFTTRQIKIGKSNSLYPGEKLKF